MKSFFLVVTAVFGASLWSNVAQSSQSSAVDSLEQTITRLDRETFDAFNHCTDSAQFEKHASFFAENVEFYHDNGGVTWNRADMLVNTKKYVCGHFTRELIPGSVAVYPIKEFGAIELGSHRFCQMASGKCEGLADFTIVWHETEFGWKITRVLSYGHRENAREPE